MAVKINDNWIPMAFENNLALILGLAYKLSVSGVNKEVMEILISPIGKFPCMEGTTYLYMFENDRGDKAVLYDYKGQDGRIGAKNKKIALSFLKWMRDYLKWEPMLKADAEAVRA